MGMPRAFRLLVSDEKLVHHVMSRTALDGFPVEAVEKEFMLGLLKQFAALYFTEIMGIRAQHLQYFINSGYISNLETVFL